MLRIILRFDEVVEPVEEPDFPVLADMLVLQGMRIPSQSPDTMLAAVRVPDGLRELLRGHEFPMGFAIADVTDKIRHVYLHSPSRSSVST